MLMNLDCSIVQSIKVSLTFDNNKVKEREISVGDLCMFEFNKNGKRKTIEGKVVKICAGETVDVRSWYIIVDGSLSFSGQMERFCPTQILDVDVIQKHDAKTYIGSPNDSTRITDMKYEDGCLKVSIDGGYSFFIPKIKFSKEGDIPPKKPNHDQDRHHCHHKSKPVEIEGDDEDDLSDEIEDENTNKYEENE